MRSKSARSRSSSTPPIRAISAGAQPIDVFPAAGGAELEHVLAAILGAALAAHQAALDQRRERAAGQRRIGAGRARELGLQIRAWRPMWRSSFACMLPTSASA